MQKLFYLLVFSINLSSVCSQPAIGVKPPSLSAIREVDLRQDLFALASDAMRGKRAGTVDELRAAAWVAEQARKAGLQPAGDDGTYFQYFQLRRTTTAAASVLSINGTPVRLWKDAWITSPVQTRLEAPVTWLQSLADSSKDLKGKVVAMHLVSPAKLPAKGMSLWV